MQCAIPGFWGELSVDLSLRETASLAVDLRIERRTVTQTDVVKSDVAIVPSSERVQKARQKLSEYAGTLRLVCPVPHLSAKFRDGHLVTFEITEVSTARAG